VDSFRSRLFVAFGDGLRGRGARRRRPVGLASLRSEPERDGEGVAEERQRRLATKWERSLRGAKGHRP